MIYVAVAIPHLLAKNRNNDEKKKYSETHTSNHLFIETNLEN